MKNKFLLFLCLIFLCLIDLSYQIFFILEPFEQRCISKDMDAQSNFSGVFFSSGDKEDSNRAIIKNSENQIIWELIGHSHGNFNLEVKANETTANVKLTVSFEFFDEKKDDQLISVHNIENLNTVIHNIRKKLDIIHSNMRNSAVRRGAHLDISNSIASKITFYTVIKILFLVAFSVFQIMMLTSILGKNHIQSKIVVTQETQGLKASSSSINSSNNENIFL